MTNALRFVYRTIVGGVVFLLPLLLLLVLVRQAVKVLGAILSPVASHLPIQPSFGMDRPEIAAALLLLLLGFLAGLIAQAGIASRASEAMERMIVSKMPGFRLFKSIAQGAAGIDRGEVKVVMADIDGAWIMGFILEQHASGLLTVYIPSAPTPTSGSIYFLNEHQVRRVNVPPGAAAKCIMQLGAGAPQLLEHVDLSRAPAALDSR